MYLGTYLHLHVQTSIPYMTYLPRKQEINHLAIYIPYYYEEGYETFLIAESDSLCVGKYIPPRSRSQKKYVQCL